MAFTLSMITGITEAVLAVSDRVEFSILVKATIILLLGLAVARLAARASASLRHLLLAVTFATLLALPLMVMSINEVTIEVPISSGGSTTSNPTGVRPLEASTTPANPAIGGQPMKNDSWSTSLFTSFSSFSWRMIIGSLVASGALLLVVSLIVDLWRLRRLRRNGLPWLEGKLITQALAIQSGVRRSIEVLLHEKIQSPITCGVRHPAIMLPTDAREWHDADLRRALVHELEHVRRYDWVLQLAAQATCAFYWFHPLVWVVLRRLRLEAERACDDAVVQKAEHTEYAEQLVMLARRLSASHASPTLGMANRSDLSARISALLDNKQRRGRAGRLTAASVLAIASLIVLAIAPVRTTAQFKNPAPAATQESGPRTEAPQKRQATASDDALFEAAKSGDLNDIDRLLKAGANVNCVLDGDGSPLIVAAREGHLEAVRLLLERGANPDLSVPGDGNPLIMAAREGHLNIVALLLDRGANVNQMVPDDENALIQASANGHFDIVKLLASRGADVNARAWAGPAAFGRTDGEWRTPLSMARKGGHNRVVDFLLSAGARE